MIVAELVQPGRIEFHERPVPVPGPGEVLLRVEAALTCGTDLKTFQRGHPMFPMPCLLGHEVSGTVAAAGAGVRYREGDPLACVPTAPCLQCRLCLRGHENLCPAALGRVVLGAFAEYLLLPEHIVSTNTFLRPATITAQEAAALEPLSCVMHGAARIALDRAETVLILGDGAIALLFAQVARAQGAGRVAVAGRHDSRLAIVTELGAFAFRQKSSDFSEQVFEWTGGHGADIVIECVGRPEVWESAAELVAPGGELLAFGGCAMGTRASFDTYRLHYEEIDVKGAFHYSRVDVRAALNALESGAVRVRPLITHERPLDQLLGALELAMRREAVKVAVQP
jgi:L-iditol 2-dehydrogenase